MKINFCTVKVYIGKECRYLKKKQTKPELWSNLTTGLPLNDAEIIFSSLRMLF